MEIGTASLIFLFVLIVLLLSGTEIAVVLGSIGSLGLLFYINYPVIETIRLAWTTLNAFELCAVPLFILMGQVFHHSNVTPDLFRGADKWLGALPGGVACSVIGACGIFAAISGSSPATAGTIGAVAFPEMKKRGYDPRLAFGTIAAGGSLGILIPPSVTMIIYGSWENISIARLFAGGILPGVLLALLFMLLIVVRSILNPKIAPQAVGATWKERLNSITYIGPWLAIIFLVLGGIFGGVVTPTEAGAVGVFLAVVLGFVYRRMSFEVIKQSLLGATKMTCMIFFIVVGAKVISFVVIYAGLSEALSSFVMGLPLGKYGILSFICVMYLVLGCIFDPLSMMLLTLPFVMPIIYGLGMSGVWFGILLVVTIEAAMITPPIGLNLYVLQGVEPEYKITTIAAGAAPFLIPMIVIMALVIAFPQIVLWLPSVLT